MSNNHKTASQYNQEYLDNLRSEVKIATSQLEIYKITQRTHCEKDVSMLKFSK